MNNKSNEAKKWLNHAKEISPDDIRNDYEEANYLFKIKNTDEALKKINQFLKHAPKDLKGIILRGMIQLEKKDFKAAYATFSALPNKKLANYYKLISLVCYGKFDLVTHTSKKMLTVN